MFSKKKDYLEENKSSYQQLGKYELKGLSITFSASVKKYKKILRKCLTLLC
jgi:hypothetical protein